MRTPVYLYLGLLVVLALSFVAYHDALDAEFHYDDYHSIVYNPYIKDIRNLPEYFTSFSASSGEKWGVGGYRPVVTASLALNYAISEYDPKSYHALNIVFHLVAVAVVFLVSLFLVRKAGGPPAAALLAAALFGLHPVQTNAVTYVI